MNSTNEIQGYKMYPMLHFRRKFSSGVTPPMNFRVLLNSLGLDLNFNLLLPKVQRILTFGLELMCLGGTRRSVILLPLVWSVLSTSGEKN